MASWALSWNYTLSRDITLQRVDGSLYMWQLLMYLVNCAFPSEKVNGPISSKPSFGCWTEKAPHTALGKKSSKNLTNRNIEWFPSPYGTSLEFPVSFLYERFPLLSPLAFLSRLMSLYHSWTCIFLEKYQIKKFSAFPSLIKIAL